MLSKTPENTTRCISFLLVLGWAVITASLFYDPFSIVLTSPDAAGSPFNVFRQGFPLRNQIVGNEPYSLGVRVFWSMIVPIVPIFLMTFGHEAWRRICPLSAVSQIARRIGWTRKITRTNAITGETTRRPARISPTGWLRRNHHMVQFTLLAMGVLGRTLFYNSDRSTLAAAFLIILILAFTVGFLYDGKAWCQNFCPVSVIQSAYTGPGGLLDSPSHLAGTSVRQSMCRTPNPVKDKPACVGCTINCSDVNLEASYWANVDEMPARLVYYGLFGLIVAFYSYYYVYSGTWSYYYSGVWTHEHDQLAALWSPGVSIGDWKLALPKIVVAPLYFVACIATSMMLWLGVEAVWQKIGPALGGTTSPTQRRHVVLTICGSLCFLVFYIFAGQPNIQLLPDWLSITIDLTIVGVAIAWTSKSLRRNQNDQTREKKEWLEISRGASTRSAENERLVTRTEPIS